MPSPENKVEVEIFNQKFTLFSERDDKERIIKLAATVDSRMREIYRATKLSSALKIALLTAINLADELSEKTDGALAGQDKEIVQRIFSLVDRMEQTMRENSALG